MIDITLALRRAESEVFGRNQAVGLCRGRERQRHTHKKDTVKKSH